MFAGLSLVVKWLGFRVARDVTHSLVGIVDLAAVFTLGPSVGAWAAVLSSFTHLELRALRHRLFSRRFMVELPIFSSGLRALMTLGCGEIYIRLGGIIAPAAMTWQMFAPLLTTLALWFLIDHIAWGFRAFLRGGMPELQDFLSRILTYSMLVELFPLPLSIILALAYVGMGHPAFVLLASALVASGALVQRLTQIRARLEERVAELAALSNFGRSLVKAQLDTNQLCHLLYQYCCKVVKAPVFILELVQEEQGKIDVVIHVEQGKFQPCRTIPMTQAMRWMAGNRKPFLSNNISQDNLPFELDTSRERPQSILIVPLLAGAQLIGTLSLQSYEPYAFDQGEVSVLSTMANQAAMAIANARAYEAEQRRAKQLAAISRVSQQVAAILELDELFAYVVKLIQETFHYYHVCIFTVDADTGEVTFRASTNPSIQERSIKVSKGEGIIGWVAQFGEPILSNDVTKEPRYRFIDALGDTRAELAVPLKVEDRIVGVLDVQSNEKDVFSQDDLFVLQTLAAQVAIAIEDARLYAARQEEAWISTALLQVAEAVGSLDNLDEILETVVRITPMLVGVDRCSILLWDNESQEFVTAKGYTKNKELRPLFNSLHFRIGDMPLLDQLHAYKHPIAVEDSSKTQLIPKNLVEEFHVGNLLALPIRAQAEIHGAMLVDYFDPQTRFSDRKKTILIGIADQAAMAIANARLHIAQREEAWVSTALLQVAQAIASSPDLQENLSKITRLTTLLVGVDQCLVFLREEEHGGFTAYDAHGLSHENMEVFHKLRFMPGEAPLFDEIATRQQHIVIENASESELIPKTMLHSFGIKSALAVPLISKGNVLGALLVSYTRSPHRFLSRKISIIEGIAHQTAIAIENARLYQAALEQERTAQELRLAREIQISFLPEHCPSLPGWDIAADWHAARGVGGDFYDFIPLGRDRLGLVIADVSDKGIPAALFMSLSRTLVRASATKTRSPAKALQHVNKLLMTETRSGMFVTLFYAVLNWRTGSLLYANAGHNPPILWRGTESRADILTAKGIALGVIGQISLEERQITVDPGDVLVLYTDGVTEPINEQEEEFGEERLIQAIASAATKACPELVKAIHAAVSDFAGDRPQFDDYTLVAVKREK